VKHSAKALARQARAQQTTSPSAGSGHRVTAQLAYWLVLAGVVAGLATVGGGGQAVRAGTLVIAGTLLAGSLARLVLPHGKAGMLGSRRRLVDVAVLAAFGIGLLIAGLVLEVPR